MKKLFESFLTSFLVIAILSSFITVPVFAETSSVYYQNDFNSATVGAAWDSAYFPSSQSASVDASWSSEMMYASKSDNPGAPLNGGDRDAAVYVSRGNGGSDKAFRFGKSQDGTNSYSIGAKLYPSNLNFTKGESKVLHLSLDMLAEDKIADKGFYIRRGGTNGDKSFCEIIRLASNGRSVIFGNYWSSYEVNQWYSFDLYFDFDARKVYICQDGKFVAIYNDPYFSGSAYSFDILKFETKTNQKTGMCIDNFEVSVMDKNDVDAITTSAAYAKYRLETFDGLYGTGNLEYNEFINIDSNNSALKTESALFGKKDSDISFSAADASPAANSTSPMPDVYLSKISPVAGDIIHYSTLIAIGSDSPDNKIIRLHDGSNDDILTIANSGWTTYGGGQYFESMEPNQWYRYDFVMKMIDTTSYTLDIYQNGVKYVSDKAMSGNLASAEITTRYSKFTGVADGMYIDDITLAKYSSGETVISPERSLTNANVSVKTDKIVNVGLDYTVGQFIADTSCSVRFEVRDSAGYVVASDAPLAGNNVVLFPKTGGEIYLPAYAVGYTMFENDFDTAGDELVLTGGTSEINLSGKGKATKANFITVGSGGTSTLRNKSFMYFNTDKVTAEASILAPNVSGASATFYLDESADKRNVLKFASDGKILYSRDDIDTGLRWTPGCWYHVAVMFNINAGGGIVYLNGKALGINEIYGKGSSVHFLGLEASGAGTVVAIDNMKVYDGVYDSNRDNVEPFAEDVLPINSEKHEIYIAESDNVLVGDLTNAVVYDGEFSALSESDVLSVGNIAVLTSESGNSVEYYYIKDISDSDIFIIKQDGEYKLSNILTDSAIDVNLYNTDGTLFVAQYDDNELIELNQTGGTTGIGINANTTRVKIMCFSLDGSITPLKVFKEFSISR